MTDINQAPATPKRKGGWPAGKPRASAARRAQEDEAPIDRAGIGHNSGRAVALGRDGQELTRKRTVSADIFHIPPEIIPRGWDYQWNVLEVTGMPQTGARLAMAENGWRAVPSDRHPGMFMPEGYKGPIIRDGLQLEERPMILSEEAKREEYAKATRQMADQQEQLGLVKKMPDGFSRDNPNLRRLERQGTSRSFAPAPDAPRPQLHIDQSA